ncbi:alpha/beta hydrolase family protein [Aquipseudomonas alcaligenes]|uniref:alpha/beta hydrolase family protein n=1 Tax=Aquipseudomonas alcaligenes TaxID=43263 RepID=UPI0037442DEB
MAACLGGAPDAVLARGWAVGLHHLTLYDPLDQQPMQAIVFYPASLAAGETALGLYRVAATRDAPIAMGRFPLILLSHGNSGSPLAHHDLATALARQGFVVLAVVHPGDNDQDQSRQGSLSNLYGRPLQLSAAIDAAAADPLLAASLDSARVGVIGYSAGGESALILAGAQPRLQHLRDYCLQVPDDADACATRGELRSDREDLQASADRRVAALLLLAPLGLLFDQQELAQVRVPVLLYSGDHDQVLALQRNAGALRRSLPLTPEYRLLPGAGHFVFMAPCTVEMAQLLPYLCEDAEGVDRAAIHHALSLDAARFFTENLGTAGEDGR